MEQPVVSYPGLQVKWVSWMNSARDVVITPETSYSDIIVPTQDTVRMSFLMDMLLSNKKPVSVPCLSLLIPKLSCVPLA